MPKLCNLRTAIGDIDCASSVGLRVSAGIALSTARRLKTAELSIILDLVVIAAVLAPFIGRDIIARVLC